MRPGARPLALTLVACLFAATYPDRTTALVMIGAYAKRLRDASYPWGPTAAQREDGATTDGDERRGDTGDHGGVAAATGLSQVLHRLRRQ